MSMIMMRKFLEGHEIDYTTVRQSDGSASRRMDLAADRPDRMLAETVILKIDGGPAMAVIPLNHRVRLELLKEIVDAQSIRPADAQELDDLFPDCDADAIPPFGMLYGMRVFAAESLGQNHKLAFYAGSRKQVAELLYSDYARLVRPIVAPISTAPAPQTRARPGHGEDRCQSRTRRATPAQAPVSGSTTA